MATLLLLELALRASPRFWPRGVYAMPRINAALGLKVHGAPTIYHRERSTLRVPNDDGFLDVPHTAAKPSGVIRVGFFGDSYVEALQVPLEQTFFRNLPAEIAGSTLEPFAFGISGWGTLHALLTYRVMGPRYDLDEVVYVFVRNDPGDNDARLPRHHDVSAELSEDDVGGFVVIPTNPGRTRDSRGLLDRVSMLARIVRVRRAEHRAVEAQQRASTAPPAAKPLDQNDRPSNWPPDGLAHAKVLTRRILAEFRDEVVRDGRRFSVLYVPDGPYELSGRQPVKDSWLPWLSSTCAELDIPLWNPSEPLGARQRQGVAIYDDHWTPEGHRLVASFIAQQLVAERSAARGSPAPSAWGHRWRTQAVTGFPRR